MKWFKFYGQDWLTDIKITKMSIEDRLCFIALLCLASASDDGIIRELDEKTLIEISHIPDNQKENAQGCLKRYQALQIVTLSGNGEVTVRNYIKRQQSNASNAEKQKRYRERLKQRISNPSNVTVTQVTPVTQTRLDKTRLDKIEIVAPEVATAETPFSFEEEIKKLATGKRADFKIIVLYWLAKGWRFENKAQFNAALKRELRAALALKGYEKKQIMAAIEYCKNEYPKIWKLETVAKQIDDVIKSNA